ncbi:MAG TPA: hypothetical protein VGI26_03295 [Solirubrobacteraceae bacterium]
MTISGERVRRCAVGAAGFTSAAVLASAALSVGGCGGVLSPDLFIVYRSGAVPSAKLTVLVTEEGAIQCNPNPSHPVIYHLSDSQIIEARNIQEDLKDPASRNESFPAAKGSVLGYYVRDQDGSVHFADNSPSQPAVTRKLAGFVLNVAQSVCHIPQQGA